ncbi:MAG TPA: hypothetical protein VLV15_01860 [Dongiaceae bacterium]|nr:hypothetical protein [Dongiaceae bacterium]
MRRYLVLLGIAALLSLVVAHAGRTWAPRGPRVPAGAAPDSVDVEITLTEAGVTPPLVVVPKNRRVVLTVTNHRRLAAGVTLQGYQDVLTPGTLAPGATWRGRFLADRPGDDFRWMVEGEPSGRFTVAGSHLVDGHR